MSPISAAADPLPLCCWCGKPYTRDPIKPGEGIPWRPFTDERTDKRRPTVRFSRDPFTWETQGELLVLFPACYEDRSPVKGLAIALKATLGEDAVIDSKTDVSLTAPFTIFQFSLLPILLGRHRIVVHVSLTKGDEELGSYTREAVLSRQLPKENEVKIDGYNLGLLVSNMSFIPFGFYYEWTMGTDHDVNATLQSGYSGWLPYRGPEMNEELNRFADNLWKKGVRIHPDVNHLYANDKLTREERFRVFDAELAKIRDHPGLLAHYGADEPDGNDVDPTKYMYDSYDAFKAADPHHPVTVVLNCMSHPTLPVTAYLPATDILMGDPYCIALRRQVGCDDCSGTVLDVTNRAELYLAASNHSKPFWLVGQTFGGQNDHWERPVTPAEGRLMLYLSLIHGTTGYFWFDLAYSTYPEFKTESGTWARETQDLTPAILSGYPIPVSVTYSRRLPESVADELHAAAWFERSHGDLGWVITLLVVNPSTEYFHDFSVEVRIAHYELGLREGVPLVAEMPFLRRKVKAHWATHAFVFDGETFDSMRLDRGMSESSNKGGAIILPDTIAPFSTAAYRIRVDLPTTHWTSTPPVDISSPLPSSIWAPRHDDLVDNGSFEEQTYTGWPDHMWLWYDCPDGEVLSDSRLAMAGYRSMRVFRSGLATHRCSFYSYEKPVEVNATVVASVWARGLRGGEVIVIGDFRLSDQHGNITLTTDWTYYRSTVVVPTALFMPAVHLLTPGTIWVDLLSVVPA